ncbi:MAG: hypothetical protein HXY40_10260 [Chloroflexi bacterium]|nr:hypothetical protein [Chloroflexota bacterium]
MADSNTYLYLDSEAERRQLVDEISRTRRAVLQIVDIVPVAMRYEPRYHGWSLAAMLAHLHNSDNASLLLIQLGILGIRLPISRRMNDSVNNIASRIFRQRVIETTIKDIQRNEKRISDFVMRLPINKFTREIFHPDMEVNLTIERAVQALFLYHWQGHLQTMRQVEGIQKSNE